MENETWKDIPGYEGHYQVSDFGRIRSVERRVPSRKGFFRIQNGRIRKPTVGSGGYIYVTLNGVGKAKTMAVHRLVLMAFDWRLDFDLLQGNHKDGVKSNNVLSNLEWCTPSENRMHSFLVLGNPPPTSPKGALSHAAQPVIGRNVRTGEVRHYDFMSQAIEDGHKLVDISNCTGHRQRTARGWEWRKPEQQWREPRQPRPELTICKNGHPYTAENTRMNNTGSKVCIICLRVSGRKANKKQRMKKKALESILL